MRDKAGSAATFLLIAGWFAGGLWMVLSDFGSALGIALFTAALVIGLVWAAVDAIRS